MEVEHKLPYDQTKPKTNNKKTTNKPKNKRQTEPFRRGLHWQKLSEIYSKKIKNACLSRAPPGEVGLQPDGVPGPRELVVLSPAPFSGCPGAQSSASLSCLNTHKPAMLLSAFCTVLIPPEADSRL